MVTGANTGRGWVTVANGGRGLGGGGGDRGKQGEGVVTGANRGRGR